jgi:hypothetical protein
MQFGERVTAVGENLAVCVEDVWLELEFRL